MSQSIIQNLSDEDLTELYNSMNDLTDREWNFSINNQDTKFQYHLVRLMLECETLLTTGDMDMQKNRELLKSIRRGEWTVERIDQFFDEKTLSLETCYANSKLPDVPDEDAIKKLLMDCIESHYGTISKAISQDKNLLEDLHKLVERYTK